MFMKPASHASPVLCLWLCSKRSLFQSTSVQRVEFLGARSRGFLHDSDPQLNKMLLLLLWECETCETQKWKNIGACWGPELAALLSLLSVLSLLSLLSYKLERSPFNKSRKIFPRCFFIASSLHDASHVNSRHHGWWKRTEGSHCAGPKPGQGRRREGQDFSIELQKCWDFATIEDFFDPKFWWEFPIIQWIENCHFNIGIWWLNLASMVQWILVPQILW